MLTTLISEIYGVKNHIKTVKKAFENYVVS